MNIIDCHLHLYDEKLVNDLDAVIKEACSNNVRYLVNNSDSFSSFDKVLNIKKNYPSTCFSTLGIHPEYALEDDSYFNRSFKYIEDNIDKIVAIGEIDLDYHYSKEDNVVRRQKEVFISQLKIAKKFSLPVVIHARDSLNDVYKILKEEKIKKAYLHCYSGSLQQIKEFIKLSDNYRFGVGGVITFKNARVLKDIVKEIDLKYFLSETDAPYLAPTPFRGERNKPSYLPLIIKEIADIKGMDEDKTAEILSNNGVSFYGIQI